MWNDLRYAARVLRRSPSFAATAILTIAIGIGANAALFSLANALYWKALPVRQPEQLVAILRGQDQPQSTAFSYPLYTDVRDTATSFTGVIAFSRVEVLVGAGENLMPALGQIVSGNYFAVLGVSAALGQPLVSDDDRNPGGHPVVVLSDAFWRARFGANREVIGETVLVNHRAYTIVGVAPRDFEGTVLGAGTQLWVPMAMQAHIRPPSAGGALRQGLDLLSRRSTGWLYASGRLREGVTSDLANAELRVIAKRLEEQHPDTYRDFSMRVEPIAAQSGIRASSRSLVGILFGVVGLVLLVACANVAGLLIARTGERAREISILLAIGASRRRLIRHLLTEHLLLTFLGGLLALVVAQGGTRLLRQWVVPSALELPLDWRVVAFTMLLVVVTGVLIALLPAWRAVRTNVNDHLRGTGTATGNRALARQALAAIQVAVSIVLVVSAGLALRTLWNVSRVDPGYTVDRISVVPIDIRTLGMTLDSALPLYEAVLASVRAVPGVEAAALVRVPPLAGGGRMTTIRRPGAHSDDERSRVMLSANGVTTDYFRTLGVPLVAGREFLPSDAGAAPRVAVLSRAAVRELVPEGGAVGRALDLGDGQSILIVGVVADARYESQRASPRAEIFFPVMQQPELGMTLLVRSRAGDRGSLPSVLQRLRDVEPRLPLNGATTLADLLAVRTRDDRMFAWVVTALAGVTLGLAALGIYGVVAFLVSQRRREVGVRLALGATGSSVVGLILRQHALVVAIGLLLGLGASSGLERILRGRLFDVPALDLVTYASSAVVMVLAASLAAWLPARRAASVDPMGVLRSE